MRSYLFHALFFLGCLLFGAAAAVGYRYFRHAQSRPTITPPILTVTLPIPPPIRGLILATPPDLLEIPPHPRPLAKHFAQLPPIHANWVLLQLAPPTTPEAADRLRQLTQLAHAQNLKLALEPLWPTNPTPRPSVKSVKSVDPLGGGGAIKNQKSEIKNLLALAQSAQSANIDLLILSAQPPLPTDESFWHPVLADLRKSFHQPLAFAASPDDYAYISFYDAVDYLAVRGPFHLTTRPDPTPRQLELAWTAHLDALASLSQRTGKPALLLNPLPPSPSKSVQSVKSVDRPGGGGTEGRAIENGKWKMENLPPLLSATLTRPNLAGLFLPFPTPEQAALLRTEWSPPRQ